MFGLVGFLTVIFNVVLGSLRQALTPDRLLGRVISAFRLFGYGAVPSVPSSAASWPGRSACAPRSWSPGS
jgi:hypothetical protein